MTAWSEQVSDEAAMQALGARLAGLCQAPLLIYLLGELGAGKSTLARGFIAARGYAGHIKSPTYTLVESYNVGDGVVYHLDLYRLNDPEELEFMGIRDFFSANAISLIEWPEKGQGFLPAADLLISIAYLVDGRRVEIEANSPRAAHIINKL